MHRRDVWGDDPEEREAEAFVERLPDDAITPERRWHHRSAFVPFKVVGAFIGRNAKRLAVTLLGVLVVLAGILMLVLPGPGIVTIIAGLAILATEYVWAERLLAAAKARAATAKDAALERVRRRSER
ncbi:MAG: PGPGW domain-containing protein [Actinomycetota bacterium]